MMVGVVITNLLYLIVAIGVAVIGALVVVLRHRKPKSVEANVASFHRGLRALAPDQPSGPSGSGPSWGGASRRAATTPSSFKRAEASGGETTSETLAPPDGEHEAPTDPPETDVEAGPGPADPETGAAIEDDADIAGEGAEPVDPVHLTSRMRRPSSGSPRRASDESGVPTEEAGTG
jgi:hypothetical protein